VFSLDRLGVELVEQDAVDFGGVFGAHPVGVGVGCAPATIGFGQGADA
jgi:hypothetical protein